MNIKYSRRRTCLVGPTGGRFANTTNIPRLKLLGGPTKWSVLVSNLQTLTGFTAHSCVVGPTYIILQSKLFAGGVARHNYKKRQFPPLPISYNGVPWVLPLKFGRIFCIADGQCSICRGLGVQPPLVPLNPQVSIDPPLKLVKKK